MYVEYYFPQKSEEDQKENSEDDTEDDSSNDSDDSDNNSNENKGLELQILFKNLRFKDEKLHKFKNIIEFEGSSFRISCQLWFLLFDFCVDPIINHIEKLLEKVEDIKYLCFVGGFSQSKYLLYKIEQKLQMSFAKLTKTQKN